MNKTWARYNEHGAIGLAEMMITIVIIAVIGVIGAIGIPMFSHLLSEETDEPGPTSVVEEQPTESETPIPEEVVPVDPADNLW